KVRYKQTLLGASWAILQPVSLMLVYTLIFSGIAKMPSNGLPYAIFVYAALLPWMFFSTVLGSATNSLVSNNNLITKVYFPREILPLTYLVAALFDFIVASSVLGTLMIYYDVPLTKNALYAVPIMLTLIVFAAAMGLLFSALQVRYRDLGFAMQLLLRLWMYATPVLYPLVAVPESLRPFYMLNPMVGVIENFRQVVLLGAEPDIWLLGRSAVISLVLLLASYLYFKRVEQTMADII
ncbi:MAG TPA: ABC transporter permease, partial [Blastocatellia bacterium]|nr:ABC transporter permease [Blastocatellia bacterium]